MNFLNIGEIMNYIKNNLKNIIIIILLLLTIGGGYYLTTRLENTNDKYEEELKLREALTDSIEVIRLKSGEVGVEKRTLQTKLSKLTDENINLNNSQKELIKKINTIQKERKRDQEVFAAARVKYETFIDSLNSVESVVSEVDTTNNILKFRNLSDTMQFKYDIEIVGVKPFPKFSTPKIKFNKIDFPNTQTITFQFDKTKRKDYPVSFSVYNTNRYYRSNDIESYVIPEIQRNELTPSTTLKIWRFIKRNSDKLLFGGIGYGIGKFSK